ncbi:MAG: hypothetical protein HQ541_21355 [Mariniphaga sp.]|nr:hypothetical protein [Mariniphaga sp.]
MKKLYLLTIASLLISGIFAQEQSGVIEKISSQLSSYYQNLPSEKIYLQTDKDVYTPGEIIWLKALVFDRSTQKLSNLSSELILKIFDNKGNVILSDYYLLENGSINGDFKLPEGIMRGRYYISAYTPLQFNAENIFTRLIYIDQPYKTDLIVDVLNENKIFDVSQEANILIQVKSMDKNPEPKIRINYVVYLDNEQVEKGRTRTDNNGNATIEFNFPEETGSLPLKVVLSEEKNYWEKTIIVKTNKDNLLLNFFAEGGNLINGFPQKIGFVSKDIWGNYISVTGDILDSKNNLIAKCQSFTDGFGLVPIQFTEDESYHFKITSEYGKGLVYELPKAQNNIPSIAVLNTDENFINTYLQCPAGKSQQIILTVTSGYQLLWGGELSISGPSRFKIPHDNFSDGIVLLSAFNQDTMLLSQRLVHIQRNKTLDFEIESSHRNSIEISISASDENSVKIAPDVIVSVASVHNFLNHGQSMEHYIKYNSELANRISNSEIIFSGKPSNKTALDYIMIANKLKGFSWNKILDFNPSEISRINNNQLGLSGKVIAKYNQGVPDAKVSILDSRTMKIYSQTTDDNGRFFFLALNPEEIDNFTITATGPNGKKQYEFSIDKTFEEQLGDYIRGVDLQNTKIDVSRENMSELLRFNEQLVLDAPQKQVKAKRQKVEPAYKTLLKNSTNLLDVIRTIKSFQITGGQIIFPGMINSLNNQLGAIIVVDGQILGSAISVLENYSPLDIDEINVYTDPAGSQKYTSFASGGLIEIFTKKGESAPVEIIETESDKNLYVNGYRIPRDYNSVMNLISEEGNNFKSTLYWNSSLSLNKTQPVKLNIPLSELKSEFIIRIEGIDSEGRIGTYKSIIKN